jgi:hypothetical protein
VLFGRVVKGFHGKEGVMGLRSAPLVSVSTVLVASLVAVSSASADPIRLRTTGVTVTAENDAVTLFPSILDLSLEPVSTGSVGFQLGGNFHVDFSPSVSPPHPLMLTQLITIDDVSQLVTLTGELSITPMVDTLSIFDTPAIAFNVGSRGTLFLRLQGTTASTRVIGDFPFAIAGTVSGTSPTPEPASLLLLATGAAAGLLGGCRRFSRDHTVGSQDRWRRSDSLAPALFR